MKVRGCDTKVDSTLLARVNAECHGKLCTYRNGQSHKTRVYTVVPGLSPTHNLGVYNNSVSSVERAFVERYFMCKTPTGFRPALPVSKKTYDSKWLKDFRSRVLSFLPNLPVLTLTQCVNLFPVSKRKVYEAAKESLEKEKLTARDASLSSFVKFEKQDVGKAPRIINPRSARYNLSLGCFLKHLEHHIFKAINKAFGARTKATVIKGFDADESAEILNSKWNLFKDPVAVGLDATKFDMHVSPVALKYEHSFYTGYWHGFRCPAFMRRFLRWLLSLQLLNRGVSRCDDGKVKFEMKGTRCSGDVNTSLGNCIIMCALVFAFAKERGVDIELCNNGDDCVVFMERSDLEKFSRGLNDWFNRYGFELTIEAPCYMLEEVEFCQTHPVHLSTGWRMVRDFRTVLKKDTMCLRPMTNIKSFRKWMHAVGSGGSQLCSGTPVLMEFYNMMTRNGTASSQFHDVSPYRFARNSKLKATMCDEARISFFHAFGVLPHMQVFMERYLSKVVIDDFSGLIVDRSDYDKFHHPGNEILTQW